MIGDYQDDFEIASGGQLQEDEQGEPLEDAGEEDECNTYEQEGPAPNEACYIDIDPIDLNLLVPLNDSTALIKAE